MCVIFCYVNSNPILTGYKLIIASNRDEFYARGTLIAGQWINANHVYGGIDLEPGREGGSWLAIGGINGIFKIGALLNLSGEPRLKNALAQNIYSIMQTSENLLIDATKTTDEPTTAPNLLQLHKNNLLLGRGMIVSNYVSSPDPTMMDYNRALVADCKKYNAFNFLSIQIGKNPSIPSNISVCSNSPPYLEHYNEGECYGFGNSLPSAPFRKVQEGKRRFQKILDELIASRQQQQQQQQQQEKVISLTPNDLIVNCLELLKCKKKYWPDEELKRRAPNWGEHLSSLNVLIPGAGYGSRTHTVILIDNNNKMYYHEETMAELDPNGKWNCTHIEKQYFAESCL